MKEFYRRHLPHWHARDAVFFVTFRLKSSLPYQVIKVLREEREREKILLEQRSESERVQPNYLKEGSYFAKWDANLDSAAFGPR